MMHLCELIERVKSHHLSPSTKITFSSKADLLLNVNQRLLMIKVNHNYTVGSLLELLNGFPSDEGVITITPDNAVIAGDFSLSAISQHGQTVTLLEASDVVLGNVSGFFV